MIWMAHVSILYMFKTYINEIVNPSIIIYPCCLPSLAFRWEAGLSFHRLKFHLQLNLLKNHFQWISPIFIKRDAQNVIGQATSLNTLLTNIHMWMSERSISIPLMESVWMNPSQIGLTSPRRNAWLHRVFLEVKEAEESMVDRFKSLGLLTIVSPGLIDGINPCAFATLIFFISYLFLYNFMFIVPLRVIFAVVYWEATSEQLACLLRKETSTIKLLNSLLFFTLAGILIFSFI